MAYIPLHHKYRPQTFADLVGQEAISTTLTNALRLKKIAPAYLFTGPRGTGKTSSARILAKSLNCMASDVPTAQPCGKCDACSAIAVGAALDIIEIDAASNTGVDNIRELIERAQYAPVQCRYKVYIIDECLTGDSLVLTTNGWVRIDDRTLVGQKVLSYNDERGTWEWKPILRWLDRGEKPTLTIKTTHRELSCTANHLLRTERGWIKAQDLKAGMKILSPLDRSYSKPKNYDRSAPVAVEKNYLTTTLDLTLAPVADGWTTSNPMSFHQWHTSLETIESVSLAGQEKVYDLEVEDNHNFVANGLLVHNCHMLTTAAFNSLLKTLEEPPDRVVFVLATTDPQRVLPTIISRCQRFDYRRIPVEAMVKHLTYIAGNESIEIDAASIKLIAQIAQGGLRDAESLLDRLSLLSGEITPDRVYDAIGSVPERDLLDILQSIDRADSEQLLDRTRQILERGKEPLTVLQNLAGCYRDLTIAKTAPQRADLVALTSESWTELVKIAQTWQLSQILAGQKHLKDSEIQLKHTTQPQLWLEIAILGLLELKQQQAPVPSSVSAIPAGNIATPPAPPATSQLAQPPIATPPDGGHKTPSPAAPTAPQNSIGTEDITATWERVLQQLLPASRDLFKPFGTLISISEAQVVVAMKSSTMQTIAAGKVPELAKVFSNMFGRSIAVKLEVLGKSQPQSSSLSPTPSPVASPPPVVAVTTPPAVAPPAAPVVTPLPPVEPPPVPVTPPPPVVTPSVPVVLSPPGAGDDAAEDFIDEEDDDDDLPESTIDLQSQPLAPARAELLDALAPPLSLEPADLVTEPTDFAEPPDSIDLERAANNSAEEPEELEVDPELEMATNNVVKLFNGEVIDRSHELFDRIVNN